jgi:hypothetical protein
MSIGVGPAQVYRRAMLGAGESLSQSGKTLGREYALLARFVRVGILGARKRSRDNQRYLPLHCQLKSTVAHDVA